MFDSPILLSCLIGCCFVTLLYGTFLILLPKRQTKLNKIFEAGVHSVGRADKPYALEQISRLFLILSLLSLLAPLLFNLLLWIEDDSVNWPIAVGVIAGLVLCFALYLSSLLSQEKDR